MKISVNRSMTVNTGNFSSVKPSVELSVDVAAADTDKAYGHLSEIASAMMALELLCLTEEMETINSVGWGRYKDTLDHNKHEISKTIVEHADKLVMMEM
jgi:hypothetical protein